MNNHIYTFNIVKGTDAFFKEPENTFMFYQLCLYPVNSFGKSGNNVHECRKLTYDEKGSYYEKIILIPKKKFKSFVRKLRSNQYKIYPVNMIGSVPISKDIFHLASSQLMQS